MDIKTVEKLKQAQIDKILAKRAEISRLFEYIKENETDEMVLKDIITAERRYKKNKKNVYMRLNPIFFKESKCYEQINSLYNLLERINNYGYDKEINLNYENLMDSPEVSMEGDIVITDPCYFIFDNRPSKEEKEPSLRDFMRYKKPQDYPDIVILDYDSEEADDYDYPNPFKINCDEKDDFIGDWAYSKMYEEDYQKFIQERNKNWEQYASDWEKTGYGSDLEILGIKKYLSRDTLYGDWGCTVYDKKTKKAIGDFCADAGMVSICQLKDILKYNPTFNDWINNHKFCVCVIKDFKGTVQTIVEESHYEYNGKQCTDYDVRVVLKGINTKTGQEIDYISSQTSL